MGVGEDFFGETDAAWYVDINRVSNVLNSSEYKPWHNLRRQKNARYLGLVLSQILLRAPYQDKNMGFRFHQTPSMSSGIWGSAAVEFVQTVLKEFKLRGWFGFLKLISSETGVGAVLDNNKLGPKECYKTKTSRIKFTRSVANFYADKGFIPIAESPKNGSLYFVGNRSVSFCNDSEEEQILTQIQSVLIACRLIHFVKMQNRYLVGQYNSPSECEAILNSWLENYCSPSSGSMELEAKFPIRQAEIRVSLDRLDETKFACELTFKPQYQIDHVLGEVQVSTSFGASTNKGAN
tara:strand:- start:17 stop:895 length:879 start_codon:yes stop_codon:yes gene_type:complete